MKEFFIDVGGVKEYALTLSHSVSKLGCQSAGWATAKTDSKPLQIKDFLISVESRLNQHANNVKRISWWVVCLPPGSSISKHTHDGDYVAVVYLDSISCGGNLHFNDRVINPERGKAIIFNSDLEHSVSVNESDSDRYSIAFNRF